MGIIQNTGLQSLVNYVIPYLNGLTCHLYGSAWEPGIDDILTDYTTIECTFPGYSPQPLNAWSSPATSAVDGIWGSANPPVYFALISSTGPYSVYGCFITDSTGKLWGAQANLSYPYILMFAGDTYKVQPQFLEQNF